MKDYARKYFNPIEDVVRLNLLRSEYQSKINRLNDLKQKNSELHNEYYVHRTLREREIMKLEEELFTR